MIGEKLKQCTEKKIKMRMINWAEREVSIACKKKNPEWDGKSFDYGCSCYQSALKAYKSLMEDNHSGYSYSITKEILKDLLDSIPLSPITDEDFFINEENTIYQPSESLKSQGLKSSIQCPRRHSLFRQEDLENNITYKDIDRYYCINAEYPSDIYSSRIGDFINKLYPITMPYIPNRNPFKVYVKSWYIKDEDADVDVVIGYKDPHGVWYDYYKVFYYKRSYNVHSEAADITDKTLKTLISKRESTIEDSIANNIICIIKDLYVPIELFETDRKEYNRIDSIVNEINYAYLNQIIENSHCLTTEDKHGICYLNTNSNYYIIIKGSDVDRNTLIRENKDIKELIELIDEIKKKIQISINSI